MKNKIICSVSAMPIDACKDKFHECVPVEALDNDVRKEVKKEILSKITDLAFRKYPPRYILKELGKDLRA